MFKLRKLYEILIFIILYFWASIREKNFRLFDKSEINQPNEKNICSRCFFTIAAGKL